MLSKNRCVFFTHIFCSTPRPLTMVWNKKDELRPHICFAQENVCACSIDIFATDKRTSDANFLINIIFIELHLCVLLCCWKMCDGVVGVHISMSMSMIVSEWMNEWVSVWAYVCVCCMNVLYKLLSKRRQWCCHENVMHHEQHLTFLNRNIMDKRREKILRVAHIHTNAKQMRFYLVGKCLFLLLLHDQSEEQANELERTTHSS